MIGYRSSQKGFDDTTQTKVSIEYEHHEIHEGNHYFISGYDTGVSDGGTITFVVTTPDSDVFAHMTFEVQSEKGITMEVYEGASGISGGDSATPVNSNCNSANTSVLTVLKNPTITSDGNLIDSYTVGARRNTGFVDRNNEIILKRNTIYVFRMTSKDVSNDITYKGLWYEHINQ